MQPLYACTLRRFRRSVSDAVSQLSAVNRTSFCAYRPWFCAARCTSFCTARCTSFSSSAGDKGPLPIPTVAFEESSAIHDIHGGIMVNMPLRESWKLNWPTGETAYHGTDIYRSYSIVCRGLLEGPSPKADRNGRLVRGVFVHKQVESVGFHFLLFEEEGKELHEACPVSGGLRSRQCS